MSTKTNYISTNRSKHYLKCHLIFVCKYRKPMLVGQLNDDIKQIFFSIASKSDFDIEVMETDNDQVHFLIRYIPRWSIAQIVWRLKQQSTSQIWQLHHSTLRKQYWYRNLYGQMVISFAQSAKHPLIPSVITFFHRVSLP